MQLTTRAYKLLFRVSLETKENDLESFVPIYFHDIRYK
jgi:hypothetical protein